MSALTHIGGVGRRGEYMVTGLPSSSSARRTVKPSPSATRTEAVVPGRIMAVKWSASRVAKPHSALAGTHRRDHRRADRADRLFAADLTKTHPAFSDMTAKLRRTIITARLMPIDAGQPTDTENRAVQGAWASASTHMA
ncbi:MULTISPECIES: hypothetical protein [Streptomyces]|uniref:Transposase n=1 Tax=Streptomyces eurythermus TaxID=42237 RepID=A0ABW6Z7P8_9ACTN|nr:MULTISPECIES: hypothetical protein [Streptomyces]QIS68786.1 hypothetical protein HB370_01085 [Streptomyces sp. DSM 40868]